MITAHEISTFKKIRREDCLNFEKFDSLYNVDTYNPVVEVPGETGSFGPAIIENYNIFPGSNGFQNIPEYYIDESNKILESIDDMSKYSFVDVGSGKGKPILYNLLKKAKYRSYLGIEIDPEFYNVSLKNINTTNINLDKEVVFLNINALDYECKNEPTVYFLYKPFFSEIYINFFEKNAKIFSENKTIIITFLDETYNNIESFIGLQEVKCNIKPLLIFKSKNV
jgi:hypothetical protein